MAYNRENFLRRVIEVQDIVNGYKKKDVPQKVIFEKYIKEQYHISYSCYNEYLGVPAAAQLKKLLAEKERKKELEPELFEEY